MFLRILKFIYGDDENIYDFMNDYMPYDDVYYIQNETYTV